jgi:hypothetical protein
VTVAVLEPLVAIALPTAETKATLPALPTFADTAEQLLRAT